MALSGVPEPPGVLKIGGFAAALLVLFCSSKDKGLPPMMLCVHSPPWDTRGPEWCAFARVWVPVGRPPSPIGVPGLQGLHIGTISKGSDPHYRYGGPADVRSRPNRSPGRRRSETCSASPHLRRGAPLAHRPAGPGRGLPAGLFYEGASLRDLCRLSGQAQSTLSRHLLDLADRNRKGEPGLKLETNGTRPRNSAAKNYTA